jgi:hypothetical protein
VNMDQLEMRGARHQDSVHLLFCGEPLHQTRHQGRDLPGGGRHESHLPSASVHDVVLELAVLAGRRGVSPYALHKAPVDLPDDELGDGLPTAKVA